MIMAKKKKARARSPDFQDFPPLPPTKSQGTNIPEVTASVSISGESTAESYYDTSRMTFREGVDFEDMTSEDNLTNIITRTSQTGSKTNWDRVKNMISEASEKMAPSRPSKPGYWDAERRKVSI